MSRRVHLLDAVIKARMECLWSLTGLDLCACRILGVPLLPPQWQVRLGEKRPERPPAQIAHLEQALPQVFPEVDPAGQRPQAADAREPSGPGRSVGVSSLLTILCPFNALPLDLSPCSVLVHTTLSKVELPRGQQRLRLLEQVTCTAMQSCHLINKLLPTAAALGMRPLRVLVRSSCVCLHLLQLAAGVC